jgi:Ca2+-binding RTX toxin-like protein
LTIAFAVPASAGAATTCSHEAGEVLKVEMSANGDAALLAIGGSEAIQVSGFGPPVVCANGPATLANTEVVEILDESGTGNTHVSILEAPAFAAGLEKIELASGGGNFDDLLLGGTSADDHLVLGATGVDTDGDGTADIIYSGAAPEGVEADGGGGADTISGQGSAGTGAAVSTLLVLGGEAGNDTIDGGEGVDVIDGGPGNDTLRGHGGADQLLTHGDLVASEDTYDGGAGTDLVSFPFVQAGVTVDLGKPGPQATGQSTDTFTGIENLEGSPFEDTLTGDAGPNQIFGSSANDTIAGGGDDDLLDGGAGTDLVSYATAPGPVTVDLEAGTAGGAAGTDTLKNLENLTGSPFDDVLTGSSAANSITPLGGADAVQALGGPDFIEARDGEADNVSCGTGTDKAVSDRRTLDTIQADCEKVEAPTEAGGGPLPDTSVVLELRGDRKQNLLKQKAVVVVVRCPEEACTASASASGKRPSLNLKPVTKELPPGPARYMKLKLSAKQRKAIRSRLSAGGKPKVTVTATATDAAGNVVEHSIVVTTRPTG